MRSISLSLKTLLLVSALGGGVLIACGGEDEPAKDTDKDSAEEDGDEKDAGKGKGKDAGKDAKAEQGKEDDEACTGLLVTCECEDEEETGCRQRCSGGKRTGACLTPDEQREMLQSVLRDATIPSSFLPDGGGFSVSDGQVSVKVGDSSVQIPGTECPAELECSTKSTNPFAMGISAAAGGLPFCTGSGGLPPTCTTAADCMAMGLTAATCAPIPVLGSMCVQVCK